MIERFGNRLIEITAEIRGARLGALAGLSTIATAVIIGAGMLHPGGIPWNELAGLLGGSAQSVENAAATEPPAGQSAALTPTASPSTAAPVQTRTIIERQPPPPAPSTTTTTPTTTTTTTPTPTPPTADPTFGHVFVISMTSPGYDNTYGENSQMPYLEDTLHPQGTFLADYKLLAQDPLPNLIAAIAGQKPNKDTLSQCAVYSEFKSGTKPGDDGLVKGDGCVYPVEALTLADQLGSSGQTWHSYVGSMSNQFGPGNCIRPGVDSPDETTANSTDGEYAANRNPFVYFHSLLDIGSCATNDVPLTQLDTDLKDPDLLSSLVWITPNLCDGGVTPRCADGSDGGAAKSDAFLQEWVPKILASKAYKKDGLLIITFDSVASESGSDTAGDSSTTTTSTTTTTTTPAEDPLKVGTLLMSPLVTPGINLGGDFDPYSMLRSLEEFYDVGLLAQAGASDTQSFAGSVVNGGD